MNKEKQIASIKQRILDEHRKHKSLDWADIAARKIYSAHLVKEKCNLPDVRLSLPIIELPKVNRVEVIDENGRSYVNCKSINKTSISMQDDGKTLKVFIGNEP